MKIKTQINSAIISAVVAMLNPFVKDLTPTNLIAAIQSYDSSETSRDARPQKPYTVAEVCQLLGISKPTVYRFFEEGVLTKLKIGNSTRIPVADIEKLLACETNNI